MAASVADSETSADELQQTPPAAASARQDNTQQLHMRRRRRRKEFVDEDSESAGSDDDMEDAQALPRTSKNIKVVVPAPARPWEYQKLHDDNNIVANVLEELPQAGTEVWYRIAFQNGREEDVSAIGSFVLSRGCFLHNYSGLLHEAIPLSRTRLVQLHIATCRCCTLFGILKTSVFISPTYIFPH
jgi:hypothetical protein